MVYIAKITLITQKMKFFIKKLFSKCGQIQFCGFGHIHWKKSLMENFIFCAVPKKIGALNHSI